jgi:peptidoglycan/xylan/chitin deacetylase (PgdA/CDA1 family)
VVEARVRASGTAVGAAVVLHGLAMRSGSPRSELVPALGVREFEQQVAYLSRRYRLVAASELIERVRDRAARQAIPVALTFDDDLASHRDLALPILQRRRAVATFFVSGSGGGQAPWWRSLQQLFDLGVRPETASPLLSRLARDGERSIHDWAALITDMPPADRHRLADELASAAGPVGGVMSGDDLAAIASAGMEVGFHTRDHDPLPQLDDAALGEALHGGGRLAPLAATAISYPHGRADDRVVRAARDAGFTVGFTTDARPIAGSDDPLRLGRLEPSLRSVSEFAYRLARSLAGAGEA